MSGVFDDPCLHYWPPRGQFTSYLFTFVGFQILLFSSSQKSTSFGGLVHHGDSGCIHSLPESDILQHEFHAMFEGSFVYTSQLNNDS